MARISLQEQYENKDVIQQIYSLKDDVNRVSEATENVKKDVIQQINNVKDNMNTVSGTAEEAKTLAQQASDTADMAVTTAQGSVTSGSIVADTVSAKLKLNKVSGASEDSVIPIASASQTGMMNAQTYAEITNIDARLSALEGKSTTMYVTFPNDDPEQSIITSTFQTKAGRPPAAGDYAVDITLNLTYGYDGSVWVKVDTDVPIPQFSIDIPGLIKGNDEDGTVFAEADGTGSVKGWDALKQSVQNNTTAIEQNSTAIEQNSTALNMKADKSELALKADMSDIDRLMAMLTVRIESNDILTIFKGDTTLIYTPPIDATGCTSLTEMFSGCIKLRSVPYIHAPDVNNMEKMFYGCSSLTSGPEMDTSNVTDMGEMFRACSSLTSVTFIGDVVPPYGVAMFMNTPIAAGNGSIFVPDNLVDAYKVASGWVGHASIIKGISEKP